MMPRPEGATGTARSGFFLKERPRFLVLDESYPVRAALVEVLHRLGVSENEVTLAECAEDALALFPASAPAIVFAEFVGADADEGLDTIHAMLHAAPQTRVILLTAEPRDAPEVRAAIRAGVFAYVEKPVRQDKIRQVLQDLDSESTDSRRI